MTYQKTGRSIYMNWEQLDEMSGRWAKKTFGNHAFGETERDETSCYFTVHGLKDEDYEPYKAYYDKYDREGDYDSKEEFETGETSSVFPEAVTLGILNEELSAGIGFHITKMVAVYDGVYFLEKNPLNCAVSSLLQAGGKT